MIPRPAHSSSGHLPVYVAIVAAVAMTACSVSTPRHGFTVAAHGSAAVNGLQGQAGANDTNAGSLDATSGGPGLFAPSGAGPASAGGATTNGGSAASRTATAGNGATATGPLPVGVTKTTITISALAGFSGNYGAVLNTIYDRGFQTWIDDVNANGGIYGRKVIAKKVDNKDTEAGGVDACKEVTTNGSYLAVSIVGFGGADVSSADCLDRSGFVTLALNLSGFSNTWRRVYSAGDAGKQTRVLASFIRSVIGDHGTIGLIHTDDPVNNAGRAALVTAMQDQHMNLVHEETVQKDQRNFVSELQRMQSYHPTTVALVVNTNEVLGILRDGKALAVPWNWTGNFWDTDENSAAAQGLFDGIKAIRNYSATNSAAFEDYKAKATKYGHGDVANSTTMALYGIGLIVGKVLTNVGPNPTKDALPAAIESIVNYNNGVTMALSFGKGVRIAEVGMWPLQCCNSDTSWKGIGDAKSSF